MYRTQDTRHFRHLEMAHLQTNCSYNQPVNRQGFFFTDIIGVKLKYHNHMKKNSLTASMDDMYRNNQAQNRHLLKRVSIL